MCDDLQAMLQLPPREYVKFDKIRQKINSDKMKCSLTTLAFNALQKTVSMHQLKRQLSIAREETKCAKAMLQYIPKVMQLNTNIVTNSFLNLMEDMVMKSSIDSPLSFKGELITLALDVGSYRNPTVHGCIMSRKALPAMVDQDNEKCESEVKMICDESFPEEIPVL